MDIFFILTYLVGILSVYFLVSNVISNIEIITAKEREL